MDIATTKRYVARAAAALLASSCVMPYASAREAPGTDIIIELRLAGDVEALPPIRSCLTERLSQMPDVKVAAGLTGATGGTSFVVDIVAAKHANKEISASMVVEEMFPIEQFQPRMKEGEDAESLLTSVQYYTLLRLHEVIPARSYERLCLSIAADFGDKVLSKEYTERDD